MASLRKVGRKWVLCWRLGGRQFNRDVGEHHADAEARRKRVEALVHDLNTGRKTLPENLVDVGTFMLSDGAIVAKPTLQRLPTLGEVLDLYELSAAALNKAESTQSTERVHLRHFRKHLKGGQALIGLRTADLQDYLDKRKAERGIRGNRVQVETLRKEIATLRVVWNDFARPRALVQVPFQQQFEGKLSYGKRQSKPPFQTMEQIERKVVSGGLTAAEQGQLWDCLFLSTTQVADILAFVKAAASAPGWLYPMVVFAAHTGARRSELMRSQVLDIDLEGGIIQLREKKRDHERVFTYRAVSISPLLEEVLANWLKRHPGGQFTICETAGEPITPRQAYYHFEEVVAGSRWAHLRGWHVFRHSFASIMAMKGIDQRIIDATLGHQTDEMRRRYRHLFPTRQREALAAVFG